MTYRPCGVWGLRDVDHGRSQRVLQKDRHDLEIRGPYAGAKSWTIPSEGKVLHVHKWY